MFVTCTTVTTNIAACRGVTLCGVAEVYRLVTGICFRHHGHWVNLTRKWLANSGDFSVYGCARLRDVTSRGKEHTKICNAVCLFLGRAIRFLWLNTVFLMPLPYLQSEVVTGSGNAFTLYAEEVHRLSKLHFFFFFGSHYSEYWEIGLFSNILFPCPFRSLLISVDTCELLQLIRCL